MKKCWKIALTAAAVAGMIPYSRKKNEETGASVTQALLWSYIRKPDGDTQVNIGLHIGRIPLPGAIEEATELRNEDETIEAIEELPSPSEKDPADSAGVPTETGEVPCKMP